MKKKIFLLCAVVMITGFMCKVVAENNENNQEKSANAINDMPGYLKKERDSRLVAALIDQARGEIGAIKKMKKEMTTEAANSVYNTKVHICYMPKTIQFFACLYRWITWSYEQPSELEKLLKEKDDWYNEKEREIYEAAQKYEDRCSKIASIEKSACKRLKKEYRSARGTFYRIGRFADGAPIILTEPDEKYLVYNNKTIEEILFPKQLQKLHDELIPITQKEALFIFEGNQLFVKRRNKLQNIFNSINLIVERHQKQHRDKNDNGENHEDVLH